MGVSWHAQIVGTPGIDESESIAMRGGGFSRPADIAKSAPDHWLNLGGSWMAYAEEGRQT